MHHQSRVQNESEQHLQSENTFLKTRVAILNKKIESKELLNRQNALFKIKIKEYEGVIENLTHENIVQLQNMSNKNGVFSQFITN
jgi:hypothetical protein